MDIDGERIAEPPTAMPKRMWVPPTSATSPSTAERSKLFAASDSAPEAPYSLSPTRSEKAQDCAAADNAVNRIAGGFYRVINVTVVRVLQMS